MRSILVVAALAAIAGILVLLLLDRPDTPIRSSARVAENVSGRSVVPTDTDIPRTVLRRNEVLRNVHPEFLIEPSSVSGTVIDAHSSVGIRDALVYVLDLDEAGVLDTTSTDPAGRFTIGLDTTEGIMLGVHANGYTSWSSSPDHDFGRETHVEVRLDKGLAIEGFVVGESGTPLSGLRIRATDNRRVPGPQTDPELPEFTYVTTELLRAELQIMGQPGERVAVSDAISDDAGRFMITGLVREKSYKLIAVSQEYLVFPPVKVRAGATDVELLAIKPSRISVSASDETTGMPVPTFLGIFRIRGSNSFGQPKQIGHSAIGHDGRLAVLWQEQFAWNRETGKVEVIAPGYLPAEGEGVFHDGSLHVEVLCRPEAPVVIQVIAAWNGGAPIQDELVVKYRGKQRRWVRAEEDGEHRFRLPRGTWDLLLAPKGALGSYSIVQVPRQKIDEDYTLNVSLKLGGDLQVSLPASKAHPWYVQLRGPESTTYGKVATGDLLVEHLEPGPWRIEASPIGDDKNVRAQIVVDVTAGGRAQANF